MGKYADCLLQKGEMIETDTEKKGAITATPILGFEIKYNVGKCIRVI